MKKLIIFMTTVSLILLASCSGKDNRITQNEDGSITYSSVDKDGKAVKYNQSYDGFDNVTVIDGKNVKALNPANISLAKYKNKDVLFEFSCDLKIVEESGKDTDVIWMINEVSANMPQVARERVPSGEWVSMKGSVFIHLTGEQTFYISSAGMHVDTRTFYLKNFKFTLAGEGIGANAEAEPQIWTEAPQLKEAYKGIFDYFGIATGFRGTFDQEDKAAGIAYHADCITAGNEFKPDFIFANSRPKKFADFVAEDGKTYQMPADLPKFGGQKKFLEACKANGVKMRGHVLVWHSQTPNWFFKEDFDISKSDVSRAEMKARQEWYIKTVMDFVADWEKENNNGEHIIIAWDVVNEAVADGASVNNWLRSSKSKWYDIYKDAGFIVDAFRFANKYAPADVKLVYNDYGCYSPGKRTAICTLIDLIKADPEARIDCVGMQAHVKIDTPVTGNNSFEHAVQEFLAKGVDVQVTELDIANGKNPYSPYLLKAKYKEFYQMFIRNRKTADKNGICGVTIWGLEDEHTWLNAQQEYKGYPQYPLLFKTVNKEDGSREIVCKPAFFGVLEAGQEASEN